MMTEVHIVHADERLAPPRWFVLRRRVDVSGVSGTGDVADGVLWPDGTASIRWRGEHPSVVFWDRGRVSVETIHGHQGATEIVFVDQDDEQPARLDRAVAAPADFRNRIADAIGDFMAYECTMCGSEYDAADAVLAILPASTDRAAVLRDTDAVEGGLRFVVRELPGGTA